jgi:hypothetical protein
MSAERESASVEGLSNGLIVIHYDRLLPDGLQMGGDFLFDAGALDWVTEKVALAAEDNLPDDAECDKPPDRIKVFLAGGHRYDDVNVNLLNWRDPAAPRGKIYGISGMSREVARVLVEQLRNVR